MSRALNAEERRLLALAKSQQSEIADASVASAWHVVIEAISNAWLGPSGTYSLANLLTELAGGGGVSVEEYAIEVSHEDGAGKTAIVSFLADRFYMPRNELTYELRRLQARFRDEVEPESPPREHVAAPAPEQASRPALSLVPPLPPEEAEEEEHSEAEDADDKPANPAAELGKVIESWAEKLRSPDADKPGSFLATIRAAMDKAREEQKLRDADTLRAEPAAAELAAGAAEAKAAVGKLIQQAKEIDRGQLAEALHHLAEWVKSPEKGGSAIDSALARLETRLKEAFDKKGDGNSAGNDAERNASAALKKVRDAMAKRIADAAAQKAREAAAAPKKSVNPDDEEN